MKDQPLDLLVFGGSFNPPHNGHLHIIRHALDSKLAHQIVLVPNAVSPFKTDTPPIAADDRVQMLELLLRSAPDSMRKQISLERFEIDRPPPSYTVDTLEYLQKKNPGQSIGFMVGADSLTGLAHWQRSADLLNRFQLIIMQRPNNPGNLIQELERIYQQLEIHEKNYKIAQNPEIDCSSTELRKAFREKSPETGLKKCMPEKLLDYVENGKFYQ